MKDKPLYLDKEPPVAWMIFNRPEKRNSVDLNMWQIMPKLIEDVANDRSIKVLIVRGVGEKSFVSGADISQFKTIEFGMADKTYDIAIGNAFGALSQLEKPVVAMIHGYCMGGGCSIALMCDLRIASDDAKFGIPAVKLGIAYSMRGTERLLNIVGPAVSADMLLTGRVLDANEAYHNHLIHKIVPKNQLESFVMTYALDIAQNAPLSMAAHKMLINEMKNPSHERDMNKMKELSRRCLSSHDYVEGVTAFTEKRKPVFKGQ